MQSFFFFFFFLAFAAILLLFATMRKEENRKWISFVGGFSAHARIGFPRRWRFAGFSYHQYVLMRLRNKRIYGQMGSNK